MTFDVKKHLIKVQGGREYLPVAARLIWFREEHPDWGISTECLHLDMEKLVAVFTAKVHNAAGVQVGQGTKSENVKGFGDFIEKAETGAIGRALAICGFGTQFAPELEEGERLADSPQPARSAPRQVTEADVTADYGPPPPAANGELKISNPEAPLSEKQLAALQTMAHKLGYEDTDRQAIVFDMFKVTGGFKSLNKGQASEVFDMLKAQLEAAK